MSIATQFCVGLENERGALAKLCGWLRQANVSIEMLFVSNDEDGVWVNMLATPAPAAEQALRSGEYHFFSEEVLAVTGEDHPGALEEVAARLAEAGININYVYGGGACGTKFMVVLNVEETERASRVLEPVPQGS